MTKMVKCKACGHEIAKSAKTCPHCGAKNKKPVGCLVILSILLIFVFIILIGDEDTPNSDDPATTNNGNTIVSTSPTATPAEEDKATMGEKNALRSAKNYLSIMPFSHAGLVKQLEYEGYSTTEAVYAADNCGADWNEQAARSAKNYLDMMAFSRSGLIEQLEYEGFTHEQAVYGVEQNGY